MRVGTFELAGYRWSDVRGMLQATTAGWRVDVDGPGCGGAGPDSRAVQRLAGAARDAGTAGVGEARVERRRRRRGQRAIRAIFRICRCTSAICASALARSACSTCKAIRVPQGIRFDNVSIHGASAHAEGQGEWLVTPEGPAFLAQGDGDERRRRGDVARTELHGFDRGEARRAARRSQVARRLRQQHARARCRHDQRAC